MSLFIMFLVCSSSIFDIVMIDNEFMYKFEKRLALDSRELSGRLLGILNANRKICKRTDTDVAFTREYSRVSIFHRERECTN